MSGGTPDRAKRGGSKRQPDVAPALVLPEAPTAPSRPPADASDELIRAYQMELAAYQSACDNHVVCFKSSPWSS